MCSRGRHSASQGQVFGSTQQTVTRPAPERRAVAAGEHAQLINIGGDKMKLLYDAFTEPEPHYSQMIKADKLKPIEVYPKEEMKNPNAVWDVKDTGVTRDGNNVVVKMTAVRSSFEPNKVEVTQGDHV